MSAQNTTIAKQLRAYGASHLKGSPAVIEEAAAELDRLRSELTAAEAQIERLRATLHREMKR